MYFSYTISNQLKQIKQWFINVSFILFALILIYSFLTWQSDLNSFNVAGIESPHLFGLFTAYLGDFCRQYIGWPVYIIGAGLIYSAAMHVVGKPLTKIQVFLLWLTPFLLSISSSVFFDVPHGTFAPQGIIGMMIARKWFLICLHYNKVFIYTMSMIILNISSLLFICLAFNIKLTQIKTLWEKILYRFEWLMLKIGQQTLIDRKKSFSRDVIPQNALEKTEKPVIKKKMVQTKLHISIPTSDHFAKPSIDLLEAHKAGHKKMSSEELNTLASQLQNVLQDFGVEGQIIAMSPGPVVTLFEFQPAAGIKTSRVISLAEDIARSMSALSARIAVIPGKNVIGIELPNQKRQTVYMRNVLEAGKPDQNSAALPLVLGEDIGGNPVIADLAKMPHLLVAGTTGSGKSVAVNAMILSLLYRYTPAECKFIMIDPKMLELSIYDDIPHLLTPVVTDPKKAIVALKWAVKEMENRYRLMAKLGVRNIDGYNQRIQQAEGDDSILTRRVQTGFDSDSGLPIYENQKLDLKFLPYIVVIVDEMADLMLVAGKDIEGAVQRLAQMARAAGIHLIMATQRPSVDVITGTIKANFPTRISFQVTSKIDSRTILGEQGGEQLLGMGDMLYMAGGGRIRRVHGPFVKDSEVEKVVSFLKSQGGPDYIESVTEEDESENLTASTDNDGEDELYKQALDLIMTEGKASTSFIQRHLQIGYNRAARVIDQMEKRGVVSPANHVGKREILIN